MAHIADLVAQAHEQLGDLDGVVGVGWGMAGDHEGFVVFVIDDATAAQVPTACWGYPVRAEVTGPIVAA